jgi:integrase
MRIGDLLALRWKCIDFDRGSIHIRETVTEGRFGSPKTKSSRRDVPMSWPTRQALERRRSRTGDASPDGLVFTSRAGTPLNPKNLLNRSLRPALKAARLPLVSWHSFRHTHATLLGEVGESLRTAQAILGHSDLETTLNVYTHAIPESEKRAVDKVAEILFPIVPNCSAAGKSEQVN